MLSFVNDYCECAHENILNRLSEIRLEKNPGYGLDGHCEAAAEMIRKACACPEAEVYFLTGGTQTNQLVIDTMAKPYEGVVAVDTGHVGVHEAGAIEFTGHKVLTIPNHEGLMHADELEAFAETFYGDGNHEHMVFPGVVYISHPTEYGSLYTRSQVEAIRKVCDKYGMTLYLDGARLAYALACTQQMGSDKQAGSAKTGQAEQVSRAAAGPEAGDSYLTLQDIARLTDVFYIGGTKCGAMIGEAVVFTKNNMPEHFATRVKQHGAMLAKGWILGVQFEELFKDDLYTRLGRNAIETANVLKAGLKAKGYRFLLETPTNQILIVLENSRMEELAKQVAFSFWEKIDQDHTAIRFCTSWGTKMEDVEALIKLL